MYVAAAFLAIGVVYSQPVMAQKPSLPQGTRDFGPLMVQRRKYILNTIETVFKKYGFMPLETPSMEQLSTLTGKYGDEGDTLLYKILNSGNYFSKLIEYQERSMGHEEMDKTFLPSVDGKVSGLDYKNSIRFIAEKGLRYDLTVPFARYVVMNRNDITLPFKRYQMQPVWRADKAQKGRYREFWQCDADVVGSNSLVNEAELLSMYAEVFEKLQLPVLIKVNNRKLLNALAIKIGAAELFASITVAIDKLEKIGEDGLKGELEKLSLDAAQIEEVIHFLSLGKNPNAMEILEESLGHIEDGKLGCEELNKTFAFLQQMGYGHSVQLDLTLARGLSYYTGAIVEVQAKIGSLKSSIGGGGRYDNLTGIFGMPGISGVGISFGLDRIYDVLEEQGLFPEGLKGSETKILFCYFDEACQAKAIELCTQVRQAGIAAEVYPEPTKKINKQLEYADKKQIPFACIIGSNEMSNNRYMVKNLLTREQIEVSAEDILKTL